MPRASPRTEAEEIAVLRERPEIRIALAFVLFSSAWILFSDSIMFSVFPDLKDAQIVGTLKGLAFVIATSVILFILIRREQSAQRRKQEEIHALNRLLQSVLDPIEDVLFVIDASHRIRYHTKGALSVADAEVRDGEPLWDLLAPHTTETLRPVVERVVATGREETQEFEEADRRLIHARVYAIPTGACVLLHDVSARKAADDERHRMELEREELLMRLQMHIDRMPIGYMVTDRDFRFVYLNPAAERMFGYSSAELRGKSPYETIVPEEARTAVEQIRREWERGSLSAHTTSVNRTRKGRRLICDWFNTPVLNKEGEFVQLISMVQDVTEMTRMIDALRLSENRYRTLIDRANDGVLTIHDGVFSSSNPSAGRMLGYGEEELVGKRPADISPAFQAEGAPSFTLAQEYMQYALDGNSLVFEWIHLARSGREVVIEVSLSPVEQAGELFLLCLWRDVTQRRQYENDLLESRSRLRALAARLDEVREEERVRLSREIHDGLGQSLTGLKIDVSLLKRAMPREAGEQGNVMEVVASMEHILDDTIAQTRQLARQLRPGMLDEVGISEAIRQYMNEFRQRSGMRVVLELSREEIPVPPRQQLALYRIAQEAITNIVRHADAERVEVQLDIVAGMAMLEVRDDGRGIVSEDLAKTDSLGIVGMSERAELLGGFCRILPRDGGGTVVHVELPLEPEQDSTQSP